MDTVSIILIAAFIGILLGIGIYFLLRYLKGSIKIKLDKLAFSSGEMVTGNIHLKTKKSIEGNRLYIKLIAKRRERSYSTKNRSTTWREIYSQEQNLEESKNYAPGFSNTYNFSIKVPSKEEMGQSMPQNEVLQTIVKTVSMLSRTGQVKWELVAILDAKGIDLASTKHLQINTSNSSINNSTNIIQN